MAFYSTTDTHSNSFSLQLTVVVRDVTPPEMAVQPATVLLDASGVAADD